MTSHDSKPRIAYLTAGGAGMFCGSCMRDNTLAAALSKLDCDPWLIPLYTPIRTDEANVSVPSPDVRFVEPGAGVLCALPTPGVDAPDLRDDPLRGASGERPAALLGLSSTERHTDPPTPSMPKGSLAPGSSGHVTWQGV